MNGFWTAAGAAEHAAIAAGSAWNAGYFVRRAWQASAPRRWAAGTLSLLFAGLAAESLAGLPVADTTAEVLRRAPLLLATLAVSVFVTAGGGR